MYIVTAIRKRSRLRFLCCLLLRELTEGNEGNKESFEFKAAPEEPNVYSNKVKTMRAPEERHQVAKSDAAPPELALSSVTDYKHKAPPEPISLNHC